MKPRCCVTFDELLTLADGAVMLDADVRAYFPDEAAVNPALRTLIQAGVA